MKRFFCGVLLSGIIHGSVSAQEVYFEPRTQVGDTRLTVASKASRRGEPFLVFSWDMNITSLNLDTVESEQLRQLAKNAWETESNEDRATLFAAVNPAAFQVKISRKGRLLTSCTLNDYNFGLAAGGDAYGNISNYFITTTLEAKVSGHFQDPSLFGIYCSTPRKLKRSLPLKVDDRVKLIGPDGTVFADGRMKACQRATCYRFSEE